MKRDKHGRDKERRAAGAAAWFALAVAARVFAGASDVNPSGVIGVLAAGPNAWSDVGGGLSGSAVYALAVDGTRLYAGGTFVAAEGGATNAAMWDGVGWRSLGSGLSDTVTALAHDGVNVYAGGYFTSAGGGAANYVAKWDGSGWSSLGGGLNGPVSALVCVGTNLYAGGAFTAADGVPANRVAVWNGTRWTGLGGGVAGSAVTALAHDGQHLYAGGDFSQAGGAPANRVARWDGEVWTALGEGLDDIVYALCVSGTNLVAGGAFASAGRAAVWNGSGWSSLDGGLDDTVRAFARSGPNLYAGGYFTAAGGVAAGGVAAWRGEAWSGLGAGVDSWVRALACDATNLYAGGYFTRAGETEAFHVAVWKPTVVATGGVAPQAGTTAGGYTVVISGSHLGDGTDVTNVTLCGTSVAAILSQSATQLVVTAGASLWAGTGEVRVFSASLGQTAKADGFTYLLAPVVWDPHILADACFGVRSNRFGFNIGASCDVAVKVEACTNLQDALWVPVATVTLVDGLFYFDDPSWTNHPARFYRLSQP